MVFNSRAPTEWLPTMIRTWKELGITFLLLRNLEFSNSINRFRKQAEIEKKKAEVRARLEAQAAGKKAKKGFMTPERKKKLRV